MAYFVSPKVLFGQGMLKRLSREIEGKGTKAVIITDKVMAKYAAPLVDIVKAAGYQVDIWDGAEPEPSLEVTITASKALLELNPQLIIGFGGGSALDVAKAAWVFYERPDLAMGEISIVPKTVLNLRKKARFVAVPTTSGTGSEVTWAIILTSKNRKIAFANHEIVPDVALLDPSLTVGMPKALTASTGLDVLGHAFDGYVSRQQTDFTDGLCLQSAKIAFDYLAKACKDGNDIVAREKMQNAATIAGLGFGNGNTSFAHALGHAMGAAFKMPHGRSIGLALPYSLQYVVSHPAIPNAPNPVQRLDTMAKFLGLEEKNDAKRIQKLIQKVRDLAREIGEPLNLKDAGVTDEQFQANFDNLVNLASKDVNLMSCPCECKEEQLRQLFREMWVGRIVGDNIQQF
ncbi:MAG: iron-containing alcohol dehydrogenase [Dehalococcoidales bacterium]|nr:iron-containing alcohol dehydrogenase [Dehalococcoidales bacterium]